jgi:hypothetical protein
LAIKNTINTFKIYADVLKNAAKATCHDNSQPAYIHTYLTHSLTLTRFKEQSSSSEAKRFSASQEIPHM